MLDLFSTFDDIANISSIVSKIHSSISSLVFSSTKIYNFKRADFNNLFSDLFFKDYLFIDNEVAVKLCLVFFGHNHY